MIFYLLAVVLGFALLVWSADRFVDGAASTAKHLGMPSLLIGILIVGFGEPQYLYLLIVLPLLAVFYFYSNYRRRKKLREYGSPELLAHLMPYPKK
jgi:hypothetical protein